MDFIEVIFESVTLIERLCDISHSVSIISTLKMVRLLKLYPGICHLLRYKNPVRTSQETHYVPATEPSQLMLCKIWISHRGDYEACRLLGYKNPVLTSQKTYYFLATEPSQLMLCKI
jgi:hypothetical protein